VASQLEPIVIAAGLAVGFWAGEDELRKNWGIAKEWHPQIEPAARDRLYKGWLKAVERTFNWIDA